MFKSNPLLAMSVFTAALVCSAFVAEAVGEEEQAHQVPTTSVATETTAIPTTTTVEIPESTTTLPPPTTSEPEVVLPVWEGEIAEVYGSGTGCTSEQASIIAREMWAVGAYDTDIEWMLQVISRESTCDSSAHNGNRSTFDDSYGLCQQNNLSGWFDDGELLENYDRFSFAADFELNAESCAVMWAACGRGPWNRGDYYCREPDKQQTVLVP